MSETRTQQLATFHAVSAGVFVLYTCPQGFRTIIKEARITQWGAATEPNYLLAMKRSAGLGVYLWTSSLTRAEGSVEPTWTILVAGDTIEVEIHSPLCDFWISGTELLL
jgi:hypothetical protein